MASFKYIDVEGDDGTKVWANTKSDIIQLKEANLRNELHNHFDSIENYCNNKNSWITPFSIFLTLLLTMTTAEFNDLNSYLNKETVKGIMFTLTLATGAWFIVIAFKKNKNKNNYKNIDELVEDIKGELLEQAEE